MQISGADLATRRARYWQRIDDGIFDRETGDRLMPFQREGIEWLGLHPRSILGDDQGLGKTVQALAAVTGADAFPCLLICKASLLRTMQAQVRRWTGEEPYVMDRGNRTACLDAMASQPRKFLIVHYEGVVRELPRLTKIVWQSILVDEATMIKTRSSQRTRAVKSLRAAREHLLSGTPLLNSPLDLWSLLNTLDPNAWPSYWKFEKRYALMGGYLNRQVLGYRNLPELRAHVRMRMVRRRKDEVLKDLPDKTYVDLLVELPGWQRKLYDRARDELVVDLSQTKQLTVASVLARLTRLKQIAVWPQATLHVESTNRPAKIEALMDLIDERINAGQKTLVFSKYRTVIEALDALLAKERPTSLQRFVFTGAHKDEPEQFQAHAGPAIWMSTIDAGGMGLTLTAADMVVFTDKDWVPAINRQAEDRAHRIGQRANVTIVNLLATETVEERIEKLLTKKSDLFNTLIEKDGGAPVTRITLDDVRGLL